MFEALILGSRVEGKFPLCSRSCMFGFSGVLDGRILADVSNIRRFDMKSGSRHRYVAR
jgi:hypothetical protein